ncbi:hypothetical protein ICE98_02457 [Lactococcus lactis]|nr:hypothetical protein [Lactococcus lactis]
MNYFKGKQFQKDVIIVAVGYYLRYNLSYREIQELLYDRGINVCHTTIYIGYKNTVKSSIISGKRKIDSPSIRGKWMKLISKSKVVGIISIVQLMRMD